MRKMKRMKKMKITRNEVANCVSTELTFGQASVVTNV